MRAGQTGSCRSYSQCVTPWPRGADLPAVRIVATGDEAVASGCAWGRGRGRRARLRTRPWPAGAPGSQWGLLSTDKASAAHDVASGGLGIVGEKLGERGHRNGHSFNWRHMWADRARNIGVAARHCLIVHAVGGQFVARLIGRWNPGFWRRVFNEAQGSSAHCYPPCLSCTACCALV